MASVNSPTSLAVDTNGNLFIADTGNNRVVEVPAGGGQQFTILSGVASFAIAVDGAGDLFVSNPEHQPRVEGLDYIGESRRRERLQLELRRNHNPDLCRHGER